MFLQGTRKREWPSQPAVRHNLCQNTENADELTLTPKDLSSTLTHANTTDISSDPASGCMGPCRTSIKQRDRQHLLLRRGCGRTL
jgi:hypothetical protein